MKKQLVSLILPNFNNDRTLDLFFQKLIKNTLYTRYEFIAVDDGSVDNSLNILKRWKATGKVKNMKIIENKHQGIVPTLNTALENAKGEIIVRLDGDATIETRGWLNKMVSFFNTDTIVGMVVAKIILENSFIHSAGRNIICPEGMHNRGSIPTESIGNRTFDSHIQRLKDNGEYNEIREVDSALGCCTMFSKEDTERIGRFDINYEPVWVEDDDFGLSIRKINKKVFYFPEVLVIHRVSRKNPRVTNRMEIFISKLISAMVKELFPQNIKEKLILELLAKGEISPRRRNILKSHYQYWEDKWGFSPINPNMDFIKQAYWDTEICWRFKPESVEKGKEVIEKYLKDQRSV